MSFHQTIYLYICLFTLIFIIFSFAAQRPPIDEIKAFLDKERKWLVPYLFKPEKDTETIAQWLAGGCTFHILGRGRINPFIFL